VNALAPSGLISAYDGRGLFVLIALCWRQQIGNEAHAGRKILNSSPGLVREADKSLVACPGAFPASRLLISMAISNSYPIQPLFQRVFGRFQSAQVSIRAVSIRA
jgi:hypothetical protein